MPVLSKRSKRVWRHITACTLIFTLILQGMAVALAAASRFDVAGSVIGVEVCHHDGRTSDVPSQTPDQSDDICCIVCLAGTSYIPATLAFALVFYPIVFAAIRWPVRVSQLPSRTVDANTRPRGPPVMA
jgi:hypothetical protein